MLASKPSHCVVSLSKTHLSLLRERSGSVVECLTPDQGAAGLILTGVTGLVPLFHEDLSSNEILSTAIIFIQADSRRIVASNKRKYVQELVNRLIKLAQVKSVVR